MAAKNIMRDYNEVKDRVEGFNEKYPDGRIVTQVAAQLSPAFADYIAIRAEVYKTSDTNQPDGTGLSWLKVPGTTNFTRGSEIENAETSAVGRALAFIGFYAKGESLASKQEISSKKGDAPAPAPKPAPKPVPDAEAEVVGRVGLTAKQKAKMFAVLRDAGVPDSERKTLVHTITGKTSTTEMNDDDLDLVLTFAEGGEYKSK